MAIQTTSAQENETPFATVVAPVVAPIPDNATGISSSIIIPGRGLLEDIQVALELTHEAIDQLLISLTSPNGTEVILHNQTEVDTEQFNPVYDLLNEPAESLETFIGENAHGEWVLTIRDMVSGSGTGTFERWGMRIQPKELLDPSVQPVPIQPLSYIETQRFATEANVSQTMAQDINQDGFDDLILLSELGSNVLIHLSEGDTLAEFPLVIDVRDLFDQPEQPKKAAIADLNQDGLNDLVVGTPDITPVFSNIYIFMGQPNGAITPFFSTQVATTLGQLDVLDYDGDAILDVVVGGIPYYLPGIGDGSFAPPKEVIPGLGRQLYGIGDINQDGQKDLLLTIRRGGTSAVADPHILLNLGNPDQDQRIRFQFDQDVLSGFLQSTLARLSQPDEEQFVLLSNSAEISSASILSQIDLNNSNNIFVRENVLQEDALNVPFRARDLNQDGLDELVFAATDSVKVFQKFPDNQNNLTTTLFENPDTEFVQPGNFTNSTYPNIAVIQTDDQIVLLETKPFSIPTPTPFITPSPTPTTDLFPTATHTPIITPTNSPTPTPTSPTPPMSNSPDINGDGIVNKLDLLQLLDHWGQQVD